MQRLIIFTIFIYYSLICLSTNHNNDSLKYAGKPLLLIYSSFYKGISKDVKESNFDVKRAYLGYEIYLQDGFSAKVQLDIGAPDDDSKYSLIKRGAYFKNAGIKYNYKFLIVNFGIIENQEHKIQEEYWGKRYIFKTFLDEYRFFPSSDLGINANFKINKLLNIEAGMMNGEYLNFQSGFKKYVYNVCINFDLNNKLISKLYSTYTAKNYPTFTNGLFLAYNPIPKLKMAGEANIKAELVMSKYCYLYGASIFIDFALSNKINIFCRSDFLNSNITSFDDTYTHNSYLNNGYAIISGAEYKINKFIRLSLNYQDWRPFDKRNKTKTYLFLNLECGIK